MKLLDFTRDDDYCRNGVIVAGHIQPTTRQLIDVLIWLAGDAGFDETLEAFFLFGSRHIGEYGDDPTGQYSGLFSGPTAGSGLTHYCDDGCPENCDMDGEDVEPINAKPATAWLIDWDRYQHWCDKRGAKMPRAATVLHGDRH